MTDLRDRIAAAVARELVQQAQDCGEYQTRDCYKVADAVIRELIRELEAISFTDQKDRSGVRYPLSDHWASSDCPDYLKKWIAAVDD